MHTAFLGTGLMGTPMARRLLSAGFELTVWNRSADKTEPLVALGAQAAASPAAAAKGADIVCLCLMDAAAVESVMFGRDGVIETLAEDALAVDFSTIGPIATRAFAERLAASRRAHWLDAPVSGGVRGAQEGTLAIFCGGADVDFTRAQPLFAAFARVVTHLGPIGAGQATKLCNQLIVSSNVLAIAEAIALGRKLGVDVSRLPDALRGGFADSIPLQIFGRRMTVEDPGPKVAEIATMLKDVTVIEAAAAADALPLLQQTGRIYRAAAARGLAHEDIAALAQLFPWQGDPVN